MTDSKSWILTDTSENIWVDELELSATDMGLPADSGVFIRKRTLRGGLRDGIDVVEINNGELSFTVVPTRGMGVWKGDYKGIPIGWNAPINGPVHPKFVNLSSRGGLGWLAGFDEVVVRCGLESNGAPGMDKIPTNTGAIADTELTLHGHIANIPASYVAIEVIPGDTPELCVSGIVEESMLFCPQFKLSTRISTKIGSNSWTIADEVTNERATDSEMELLYHCNFGGPFLDKGATFAVPCSMTMPRDELSEEDVDSRTVFRGPEPGFVEQCFYHVPIGGDGGDSVAMLSNAAGDKGVAVRFNVNELPCFTLWKNTSAESDGYVTGLEPATNFPNPRVFERRHGRVVQMSSGETYKATITLEVLDAAGGVDRIKSEIQAIQDGTDIEIHKQPQDTFSE